MALPLQTAKDWTARRVAVPLAGSSAEIALDPAFPGRVRLHSLFASKVSSANALEGLRQNILGVLGGAVTPAEGAKQLRAQFAEDAGAGSLLSPGQAESTIRLNAMMAYAVGERQISMDPAVLEAFPYWKYVATKDSRVRPDHAALDGLILRKDDPFWRTHTPPWEFGCRCALVDVSAEDAGAAGVATAVTREQSDGGQSAMVVTPKGKTLNITQPASGFMFEPDAAFTQSDMGLVKELKSRRQVLDQMVQAATKSEVDWQFVAKPETPIAPAPVLPRPATELSAEIAKVVDGSAESVSLGKLLPEHADGLGLAPEEHEVRLSAGSAHFGVKHWAGGAHTDTLGQAMDWLGRTLWQPGSEARMAVNGHRKRLILWNRADNVLATFLKHGYGWDLEAVDVWSPSEGFKQDKML